MFFTWAENHDVNAEALSKLDAEQKFPQVIEKRIDKVVWGVSKTLAWKEANLLFESTTKELADLWLVVSADKNESSSDDEDKGTDDGHVYLVRGTDWKVRKWSEELAFNWDSNYPAWTFESQKSYNTIVNEALSSSSSFFKSQVLDKLAEVKPQNRKAIKEMMLTLLEDNGEQVTISWKISWKQQTKKEHIFEATWYTLSKVITLYQNVDNSEKSRMRSFERAINNILADFEDYKTEWVKVSPSIIWQLEWLREYAIIRDKERQDKLNGKGSKFSAELMEALEESIREKDTILKEKEEKIREKYDWMTRKERNEMMDAKIKALEEINAMFWNK